MPVIEANLYKVNFVHFFVVDVDPTVKSYLTNHLMAYCHSKALWEAADGSRNQRPSLANYPTLFNVSSRELDDRDR